MNDAIDTENYKGYTINLYYDDDHMHPREDIEHFSTMVCFHRRYNLGDKHDFSDPETLQEFLATFKGVVLPLYLYDHSGITMSTGDFNDRFDSGQVGYIFTDNATIKKEYGNLSKKTLETVKQCLESEVKEYASYLEGQVYGYDVLAPNGESVASCWGFIGDSNYAIQDAKSQIDYMVKEEIERKSKAHVKAPNAVIVR